MKNLIFKSTHAFGMQGTAMFIAGLLWQGVLVVILTGHEGPYDAPQKMLPAGVRAALWCATGVIAMFAARYRQSTFRIVGVAALFIMPLFRFAGYSWSWFMSWPIVDKMIPGDYHSFAGDPVAWVPLINQSLMPLVLAIFVFFAPYAWPIYDRHDRDRRVGSKNEGGE